MQKGPKKVVIRVRNPYFFLYYQRGSFLKEKKHLLNCLSNYFDNESGINSDNVVQFILDNREIVIKDNIRLKNK